MTERAVIVAATNGRWKGVLSPEELALYAHTVETVLPPACAAWLEHGRAALRGPSGHAALTGLASR
jgi:hypothetical protein